MKSDNKGWLFWGFIVLVVINVILLILLFVGSGNVGLSPGSAVIDVAGSKISAGANYLNINVNPTTQTKNQLNINSLSSSGALGSTNVLVNGNVTITSGDLAVNGSVRGVINNVPDMTQCRLVSGTSDGFHVSVDCYNEEVIMGEGYMICPYITSSTIFGHTSSATSLFLESYSYWSGDYGGIYYPHSLPISKTYTCVDGEGQSVASPYLQVFCCKVPGLNPNVDIKGTGNSLVKKTAMYNSATNTWVYS